VADLRTEVVGDFQEARWPNIQENWSMAKREITMRIGRAMFFTDYSMSLIELARAPGARGFDHEAGDSVIYTQAEETWPKGTIPRTLVTKFDGDRIFRSVLTGKSDRREEWE
jgi:hypothetical protein